MTTLRVELHHDDIALAAEVTCDAETTILANLSYLAGALFHALESEHAPFQEAETETEPGCGGVACRRS